MNSPVSPRLRRLPRLALVACLVPSLLLGTGCTRRYYRERADREVEHLLETKGDDPRWCLEDYQVLPDDRSRFADPSDPDRPPMPPDDPAAKAYSPNPQKPYHKSGVGLFEGVGYLDLLDHWDQINRQEVEQKRAARRQAQTRDEDKGAAPATNAPGKNDHPEELPPPKDEGEPEKLAPPKGADNDRPRQDEKRTNGDGRSPAASRSPERMLEQAESEARRELADVVTVKGTVSDEEAKRAASCERTFLIKLEQAVELGLINSREYQNRREQLYLSALPVTVERFAFTPQLFAAATIARQRFGRETPDGFANRWRVDSLFGVTQLFSTGGLLLASFANRTIWGLAGDPSSSVSQISLDIIQPLLRGAGKAVTLEPLTQAERNLLYAVRDYARFRQEYYVYIASGQNALSPGSLTSTSSLSGGTVTGPGVFIPGATPLMLPTTGPRVLPQVVPGDAGFLRPVLSGGPAPQQGFLATVSEKAQLVNQYRNIQALRAFLERFRVYLEGGLVNAVQVGQVEQQLLRSVDNALSAQASYRASLDQFKLQLGVPMDIRLDVDDEPLEPMFSQTRRFEDISSTYERLSEQAQQYARPEEAAQLRQRLRRLLLDPGFTRGTRFPARLRERWAAWERLEGRPDLLRGESELDRWLGKVEAELDALKEEQDRLRDEEKGDLPPAKLRRLAELDFEVDLGRFERALRLYARRPWVQDRERLAALEKERDALLKKREKNLELTPKEQERLDVLERTVDQLRVRVAALPVTLFQVVYRQFLALLEVPLGERLEEARRRWPDLPPLCLGGVDLLRDDDDAVLAAATQAALENRLDLMNQRAQLVDSWRKIRVTANALLGTLNVNYRLDSFTPEGELKPFAFSGSRTKHQLIFNTELPLVRIQERNNYRAALIAYQRQRRELQLAEDQVVFSVRVGLRNLRAAANSYHKVQKRSVELAYQQVDQALQAFSQPQAPAGPASPPGSVGAPAGGGGAGDPAANTQQLLQAQNALLQAQNGLYNTWINYLSARMNLYRDLGIMPLDGRGVWIDDAASCCPPPRDPDPAAGDGAAGAHPSPGGTPRKK